MLEAALTPERAAIANVTMRIDNAEDQDKIKDEADLANQEMADFMR